jgi:hypothetical protein
MNKKILLVLVFFVFTVFLIYFMHRDNSVPLLDFVNNVEKRLPEIEKNKLSFIWETGSSYFFSIDTIHGILKHNIFSFCKTEIYDFSKNKNFNFNDLPLCFENNFKGMKALCNDLNVYMIHKDSLNQKTDFVFNLKYIKSGTIPNWDKKLENKKNRYDGFLSYDANNKLEKDSNYYKIKDKWYFYYGQLRAD